MEEQTIIPEITINNSKEKRKVEVDGIVQEVELPAKKGFNVFYRLGSENKTEFIPEHISAPIVAERFKILSKYDTKPFYVSNEFLFNQNVRVYEPSTKKVLYSGEYAGVKERFDTGEKTKSGFPSKSYDLFVLLYIYIPNQFYKVRIKMNRDCNWFEYKDKIKNNPVYTDFNLSQKTVGSNTFWTLNLTQGKDLEEETFGQLVERASIILERKSTEPQQTQTAIDTAIGDMPF